MKSPEIADVVKADNWSLATGVAGGKPLLIRFRPGFRDVVDVSAYPALLEITWTYTERHASGMPVAAEAEDSQEFENRLCDFLECDYVAVLTAVIVTGGTTRWVLYTSDLDECSRRIEALPQKLAPYPIELVADDDPEWKFLREEVLAGCGEE